MSIRKKTINALYKAVIIFIILLLPLSLLATAYHKGPFSKSIKTAKSSVSTTTTLISQPVMSCQDTTIQFDINTTNSLISLDKYKYCFDWFANQIKLGTYKTVNVIGRSSCDSSKENGIQISQDRAHFIARLLADAGVPPFLINSEGIGFSDPIGDCQTTKGEIANRSVTIAGVSS